MIQIINWSNLRQERTSKDERDLRSLKKRLDKYHSAKDAIFDPFFSDLSVDHGMWVISGEAKKEKKDGLYLVNI
jgi:hypothetical protein